MVENTEEDSSRSLSDFIQDDEDYYIEERKKNKKSQLFVLILVTLLFLSGLLLWFINSSNVKEFDDNSIITQALIIEAKDVSFRVNDMDGSGVSYYYVTSKYLVDRDSVSSYFKIRNDLFFKYH